MYAISTYLDDVTVDQRYAPFLQSVEALRANSENFSNIIKQMESEQERKMKFGVEFKGVIRDMLNSDKRDQSTQVQEYELFSEAGQVFSPQQFHNISIGSGNLLDMGVNVLDKEELRKMVRKEDPFTYQRTLSQQKQARRNELDDSKTISDQETGFVFNDPSDLARWPMESNLLRAFKWTIPVPIFVFLKNVAADRIDTKVKAWFILRKEISAFFAYITEKHSLVTQSRQFFVSTTEDMLCQFFLEVWTSLR
jgi:hypothetical protein